jgi:hypothetical protein
MKRNIYILMILAFFLNACSTKSQNNVNECYLEEKHDLMSPDEIFSDNTLISWIYPHTLDRMERFQKIDIRNYSDALLKHDNPVLLIYDLKK